MRDLQEAVATYFAETARRGDLGGHVRTLLATAQKLNDLFTNAISDKDAYRVLFGSPAHTGAELINAVRYARNVDQHVLHIVEPHTVSMIGGTFGMRVYALWEEVPVSAHSRLRPPTQRLKPDYDAFLQGREVTETMLGVLRFFAEIAPGVVHRDQRGEWTGFPLMSQPGVSAPLHPEEPADLAAAQQWLDSRLPNGDARVVCGQIALTDTRYVFGLTFIERHSFAPFVERVEQANHDISAGFPYFVGDVMRHVEDVTEQFPRARQGGVLCSDSEVSSWASPINQAEWNSDWHSYFDADFWLRAVTAERSQITPEAEAVAYGVRRARRLNALVPPVA